MISLTPIQEKQWMAPQYGPLLSSINNRLGIPNRTEEAKQIAAEVRKGEYSGLPKVDPSRPDPTALKIRAYVLAACFLEYVEKRLEEVSAKNAANNGVYCFTARDIQDFEELLSTCSGFDKASKLFFEHINKQAQSARKDELIDTQQASRKSGPLSIREEIYEMLSELPSPHPPAKLQMKQTNKMMTARLSDGLGNQFIREHVHLKEIPLAYAGASQLAYWLNAYPEVMDIALSTTLGNNMQVYQLNNAPPQNLEEVFSNGNPLGFVKEKIEQELAHSDSWRVIPDEVLRDLLIHNIRILQDEAMTHMKVFSTAISLANQSSVEINHTTEDNFLTYKQIAIDNVEQACKRATEQPKGFIGDPKQQVTLHCPADLALTDQGDSIIISNHRRTVEAFDRLILPQAGSLIKATFDMLQEKATRAIAQVQVLAQTLTELTI